METRKEIIALFLFAILIYGELTTSETIHHKVRLIFPAMVLKWLLKNEISFTFGTNIIFYVSQMIKEKRTKHYGLCPTGTFQKSSGSKNSLFTLPELQLTRNIDWPGSSVPRAVPLCGFEVQYLSKTTI